MECSHANSDTHPPLQTQHSPREQLPWGVHDPALWPPLAPSSSLTATVWKLPGDAEAEAAQSQPWFCLPLLKSPSTPTSSPMPLPPQCAGSSSGGGSAMPLRSLGPGGQDRYVRRSSLGKQLQSGVNLVCLSHMKIQKEERGNGKKGNWSNNHLMG